MAHSTDREEREKARLRRTVYLLRNYKRDLAERLAETRRLFRKRVYAVEIHSHSTYSDGRGSVEENYEAAMHCGLDFLFATDHGSLGQKRVLRRWSNASWGQEPGAGPQHIGLLCGSKLFKPRGDSLAADFARARKIAPFVWVPHPVGWYPSRWYSDEQIETLWSLGDEFAVEVINGAGKIVRAYDAFDRKAVTVWDELLGAGKRVTAVGGSDAHGPDELGTVWTGVFARSCSAEALIQALRAGRCFASEAALLHFTCDGKPMGSTVRKEKGSRVHLAFRVADAAGVASVRVVRAGTVVKEFPGRGEPVLEGGLTRPVGARPTCYRLESISVDDRRAFSTPIYVQATK